MHMGRRITEQYRPSVCLTVRPCRLIIPERKVGETSNFVEICSLHCHVQLTFPFAVRKVKFKVNVIRTG